MRLARLQVFEGKLAALASGVRLLPALTARNAVAERARARAELAAGRRPAPAFEYCADRSRLPALRALPALRQAARALPAGELYLDKLDELELDIELLAALGDGERVRALSARRFGTGDERVQTSHGRVSLREHARALLRRPVVADDRARLPPIGAAGQRSLRAIVLEVAARAGLEVEVRVEPALTAGAAAGERTVYVADRLFGEREALRLAVHEVLGHLVSAANARAQPLRLLQWGTAFSFADQEGVALWLESVFGLLDAGRLRTLAGRVVATSALHAGASFGEVAWLLHREHGFEVGEAVALSERAFRGGGVARDAGYLLGYLRVSRAIAAGETTADELRMGRVSLAALPQLRRLRAQGVLRDAVYRPNFSRSLRSASSGSMPRRSPPSAAASLISVELT